MYEHIDKIKKSKLICYLNHISLFFLLVYAHIIFHFKYNAYKITNSGNFYTMLQPVTLKCTIYLVLINQYNICLIMAINVAILCSQCVPLPLPEVKTSSGRLSLLVAAGPFSTSDSLSYEPLADFVEQIRLTRPDVCILVGVLAHDTPYTTMG